MYDTRQRLNFKEKVVGADMEARFICIESIMPSPQHPGLA